MDAFLIVYFVIGFLLACFIFGAAMQDPADRAKIKPLPLVAGWVFMWPVLFVLAVGIAVGKRI